MFDIQNTRVCILGLGYVGLPLATAFGKKISTIGFDINKKRIDELRDGIDLTLETTKEEIDEAKNLTFTNDAEDAKAANFYIVTVPTPIDGSNQPDLTPLRKATETIAKIISKGDTVVYESTVYPGATEKVCVPIIEEISGLKFNEDFFAGYSPERINPGDKKHRLETIVKVTSGSTIAAAEYIDAIYKEIITAGTYVAQNIMVAEAAKVIENTQRDVNIALINEFSLIFNRLGIDTNDVLDAAGTKWNFLPFMPGLVGGHCIGVDPYYLAHVAESLGYHPQIILSGRRLNDNMSKEVVSRFIKAMLTKRIHVDNANILVLGLTFKENCPDIRNTKIIDVITNLKEFNINVDVYDPWCSAEEVKKVYNINLIKTLEKEKYDGVIIAVAHNEFKELSITKLKALCQVPHVICDLKNILPKEHSDLRL
jgi:UDP-N-acetyl-D-galactosamine dehydrogenase